MRLELYEKDLRPESAFKATRDIGFNDLNESAQAAVRAVGHGTFYRDPGTQFENYNAISEPSFETSVYAVSDAVRSLMRSGLEIAGVAGSIVSDIGRSVLDALSVSRKFYIPSPRIWTVEAINNAQSVQIVREGESVRFIGNFDVGNQSELILTLSEVENLINTGLFKIHGIRGKILIEEDKVLVYFPPNNRGCDLVCLSPHDFVSALKEVV